MLRTLRRSRSKYLIQVYRYSVFATGCSFCHIISKGKSAEAQPVNTVKQKSTIQQSHQSSMALTKSLTVWMSHGDHIKKLPKEFKVTSRSENGLISSFESVNDKIYGVQVNARSPPIPSRAQRCFIISFLKSAVLKTNGRWARSSTRRFTR